MHDMMGGGVGVLVFLIFVVLLIVALGHKRRPRFTISLKRSTPNLSYLQVGWPITPSLG
jgi:hypothetical protein